MGTIDNPINNCFILKFPMILNNTKIDIDTACFMTGSITVLNLNSFEQYRFTMKINEED